MVLGHKECGKGFVYRNGECVLRSSLYSKEFYKSIFGEEPPPDDIPDNKSPQHDSGEEGHGQVIPDSNTHYDPDAGVVVDDQGETIEPVIEPDDTPSAPPARRQPVKPDASQVIKGVVSQAPTPDYDSITPMNEDKRNKKRKPDKPSGAATHTLDSIVLKAPAPDYDNIKPMDAVAIAGLGGAVVSGTAGGILITGTAESATADVIGTAASNTAMLEEMGVEGIEMTEVGIDSAAAAEGTAAAAELAADVGGAAAAAEGAAAAETVGLLGVSETLATVGVASAGETAGVGLVVLGAAAATVAGVAEVIDHSDEIENSFNDLGNEISKTFDNTFGKIF